MSSQNESCIVPKSSTSRRHWLALLLLAALVIAAGCTERYREHLERQTPNLRPPTEAFARLVLLREANKLRVAQYNFQWISYRFHQGVCFPGTIEEMEREDHRSTITSACGELRRIQEDFPHPCSGDAGCPVSSDALAALESVIAELERAEPLFAEAEAAASGIPPTE